MSDDSPFDGRAVRLHRTRAASTTADIAPILSEAAERLVDRLDDMTMRFSAALDFGGRGVVAPLLAARGIPTISVDTTHAMAARAGAPALVVDDERLPFAEHAFDLVVASLSLHWINDLPGTLIQLRRCLSPDGLLLASLPVLDTLGPLRRALTEAEATLRGGASPRISPFPELRDCAGLLQRAGFALPVADLERIDLAYANPMQILRDLRLAGEANAVRLRDRRIPPRLLFPMALAALPVTDGRVAIELKLAMMTGWAPAPTQRPPLARGQFTTNLADLFDKPDDTPAQ